MRPLDVKLPLLRHGGGGNRATAVTTGLTLHQATGMINAAARSLDCSKPLTRHVTIRLERQGIADANAVKAIGKFLTLLRNHVRKKLGGDIAYIWAREHGSIIGCHVHIVLHLPDGYSWQGHRMRRWIERISDRPYKIGTIKTTRIGGTARAHESNPAFYLANLMSVIGYVVKGANPDAAAILELDRVKGQGRIIGKRCGWSQNIGNAGRGRKKYTARGADTTLIRQA